MLRRILVVALIAGALSGFVMSGAQMLWSTPLIINAEAFEGQPAPAAEPAVNVHIHADGSAHVHEAAPAHDANAGHHHDPDAWAPQDGFERTLWTIITNVLMGVGGGLIMTAFLALRKNPATDKTGLLFGLAAFASLSLAPALGLPPELPGMAAAELQARQAWWLLTAVGTATAIAVLVYAPNTWVRIAAVAVMALPHLIGAPQPASHATAVPVELIREFIIASLFTACLFWVALGGLVGLLANKFDLSGEPASA